jgi:hypothetical protein
MSDVPNLENVVSLGAKITAQQLAQQQYYVHINRIREAQDIVGRAIRMMRANGIRWHEIVAVLRHVANEVSDQKES